MEKINTHNLIVDFGKHKGERWTRVPRSYLSWLINQTKVVGDGKNKRIAKAELERRGSSIRTDLQISGHAIDRASTRCKSLWRKMVLFDGEGLYSWMERLANDAIKNEGKHEIVIYRGIKFIFEHGEYYSTLKSIMPNEKNN